MRRWRCVLSTGSEESGLLSDDLYKDSLEEAMSTSGIEDLFDLTGKIAIVTGAARGLGRAFAEAMAEAGADVVCSDILTEELKETVKIIEKIGRKVLALQVDVTQEDDIKMMVNETVRQFGRLDIIVNNAGIIEKPCLAHELSLEEWNRVIAVNLTGVFLCAREAARVMMKQKSGKIINISSTGGFTGASPPIPPAPAYIAAKGAVVNLTRELALEYAPFGINVNSIAPGFFSTELTAELAQDEEFVKSLKELLPLSQKIGIASDLKGTAIYLASKASDFVTGHILVADQGFLAK